MHVCNYQRILQPFIIILLHFDPETFHKTKRHHSVKTERHHSVTFQSPFSWLNGRHISVTIQWPFSAIQSPFRRLSVIFNFFFSVYNLSYKALFLHIFDARSTGIMSECNTHIWYFKDCRKNCLNRERNDII